MTYSLLEYRYVQTCDKVWHGQASNSIDLSRAVRNDFSCNSFKDIISELEQSREEICNMLTARDGS